MNSVSGVRAGVPPNASGGSNQVGEKKSHINKLPPELERDIFSYLKFSELGAICLSDKRRDLVINGLGLKRELVYRDFAFNSRDWKTYCKKDVDTEGEMDSFPLNIYEELNKPCKAFPGKRVGQTHMVTWVPKTMSKDKEPLTLNSFGGVLKEYFPENSTGYRYIWDSIVLEHGGKGLAKSGWVFMTRDVLPGSKGKSYKVQKELVTNLDRGNPYEIPTTLKAVVGISARYFKFNERRFSDKPLMTYTRCQEKVQGSRVIVGGFANDGLLVLTSCYDEVDVGAQRSSVLDS